MAGRALQGHRKQEARVSQRSGMSVCGPASLTGLVGPCSQCASVCSKCVQTDQECCPGWCAHPHSARVSARSDAYTRAHTLEGRACNMHPRDRPEGQGVCADAHGSCVCTHLCGSCVCTHLCAVDELVMACHRVRSEVRVVHLNTRTHTHTYTRVHLSTLGCTHMRVHACVRVCRQCVWSHPWEPCSHTHSVCCRCVRYDKVT